MMVTPGRTGGISFDIQPSNAEIYVDGQDDGSVANYTPRTQPLPLAPGRHRVEIRAQGRQNMTFDADIQAGQVTPYQGTLANERAGFLSDRSNESVGSKRVGREPSRLVIISPPFGPARPVCWTDLGDLTGPI